MIPFPAIARAVSAAAATSELFTCCTTPLGALLVVFDFIVVVTVCLGGFAMVVVWCLFYVFFVFLKFLVCCIPYVWSVIVFFVSLLKKKVRLKLVTVKLTWV